MFSLFLVIVVFFCGCCGWLGGNPARSSVPHERQQRRMEVVGVVFHDLSLSKMLPPPRRPHPLRLRERWPNISPSSCLRVYLWLFPMPLFACACFSRRKGGCILHESNFCSQYPLTPRRTAGNFVPVRFCKGFYKTINSIRDIAWF